MTETAKNLGAFCDWAEVRLPGGAGGPLAGLRFAVKDLYDVEGHVGPHCNDIDVHQATGTVLVIGQDGMQAFAILMIQRPQHFLVECLR